VRAHQRSIASVTTTIFITILVVPFTLWLLAATGPGVNAQNDQTGAEISNISVDAVPWTVEASDITQAQGNVTLDGQPVEGAQVMVGGYRLPTPTDAQGQFTFPADHTLVRRLPITVSDASNATVSGKALTADQQAALEQAEGSINVHFVVTDVMTSTNADGNIVLSGTVQFTNGQPPPPVVLYSYQLTGTVTDNTGKPIEGVIVGTRTPEFRWSLSEPTDSQGNYTSLYWPTDPTPFSVLLVENDDAYPVAGNRPIRFPLYKSARMDVTLDRDSGTITVTEPISVEGLIYDGLLVGVMQDGAPVRPISVTWPDEQGHFQMVLPAALTGQTVEWWQQSGDYFATIAAEPGGEISLGEWPTELDATTPRGFGSVMLP
jgi:hypothetical protein